NESSRLLTSLFSVLGVVLVCLLIVSWVFKIKHLTPQQLKASSMQSSRQQQDTVYAQIKVSKPKNNSAQSADCPEVTYSQVKRY
ncbi:hypothetical protein GOODEAATRI_032798, partial [Goodea atripinnis]